MQTALSEAQRILRACDLEAFVICGVFSVVGLCSADSWQGEMCVGSAESRQSGCQGTRVVCFFTRQKVYMDLTF